MRRGIAMAVEAEFHRQSLGAIGQRHGVDAAMALDAANALCDVDVVTEEDILWQHGDAIPFKDLFSARLARPAPASARRSRSANGRSCRCGSAADRRADLPPPTCGNSGNRCRAGPRGDGD